jgi:hypothetical protein
LDRANVHALFGAAPLLLGGGSILVLTLVAVSQSLSGAELRGPLEGSFFVWIGPTASYAVPLTAIVGVLVGYALRERHPGYALGGSAVFQLAVNLAFLLHVAYGEKLSPAARWAEWLQWNAIGAAGFAIVWLGLARRMTPREDDARRTSAEAFGRGMLGFQVAIAGLLAGAIVAFALVRIVGWPGEVFEETVLLGGWLSYAAVALACVGAGLFAWRKRELRLGDVAVALAAAVVVLVATTIGRNDTTVDWLAYHALEAGWLGVGVVVAAVVCVMGARPSLALGRIRRWLPHHAAGAMLAAALVALAVRGNWRDPAEPWWSLGISVGGLAMVTAIGLALRRQTYAHASVLLAGLAAALFWFAPSAPRLTAAVSPHAAAFFEVVPLAILLAAIGWLGVEIGYQRRRDASFDATSRLPRAHSVLPLLLLPLYLLWRVGFALLTDAPQIGVGLKVLAAVTVVAWGVYFVAALWDRRALYPLPGLFSWMSLAWLLGLALATEWAPRFEDRIAIAMLALAGQTAIAGQDWSYGANWSVLGLRLGVSDPVAGLKRTERWLPVVSYLISLAACFVPLFLVLTLPRPETRIAVAFAPAVAAWGIACLADDARRPWLRLAALLMAGLTCVYLAWARLEPGDAAGLWLTRVFRLLMVLAVLTFLYGLALPRWLLTRGAWNAATRQAGNLAGIAALAAFVAVLGLEVALFEPRVGAPVETTQVGAIAVVLVVLIAGLVSLALLPGRDPLELSDKGKQSYVYAAIATAALLFAHLYVCRPMWFDAGLRPYWPLIVMGIAFGGTGAGEIFRRYRITVLAEPLSRVGAMLPLLPVLGWWVLGSETDYALLLLIVGILYLVVSVTHHSWAALLAAGVAGNGALWTLLSDEGFRFLGNPQFWIIPPALSLLLAAQVNRKRLPPAALTSIRYGATLAIYASSTSEIWLRGMEHLWPAMALLGLSVLGAVLGMVLRIRAFLYLGASFTLISLVAMVAHAAQAIEHVWPWWAFGFTLGVGLLALLALREKYKEELRGTIERLREWEE